MGGQVLSRVRLASPFLVRTVDPPIAALEGRTVDDLRRLGKRVVFAFDEDLFAVLHLMIAGRLRWRDRGAAIPGKLGLAAFDFPEGTLLLTEAGSRKQASLHVVRGAAARGGDGSGRRRRVSDRRRGVRRGAARRESHARSASLTDPQLFSGIGNAYSDEILHAAQLSPIKLTHALDDGEIARLFDATGSVLRPWTAALQEEAGGAFPEKVTAFRPGMAVHGRYRQPCPRCGAPVQRIALRAQRSELLRAVPDRRPAARRPGAVAAAPHRLAEDAR